MAASTITAANVPEATSETTVAEATLHVSGRLPSPPVGGIGAIGRLLRNRRITAAEFAFACFAIVLHGSWVAVMLYAFAQGGVGEIGIVSLILLLPASVGGPFVTVLLERLAPNRPLFVGLAVQTALMAVAAAAVAIEAPKPLVYAAFAAVSTAHTVSRPAIAALLPRIVDHPEELAAANSATELIETLGLVVGPLAAGLVVLVSDDPAMPFIVATMLLGLGSLSAVAAGGRRNVVVDSYETRSLVSGTIRDVAQGMRVIRSETPVRNLVMLLAVAKLIVGTLEVAAVPLAINQLSRSESAAGLLTSCLGVGGIVGASLSFFLIGRRRLAGPVAVGLLLASLPLVLASQVGSLEPMLLILVVAGLGRPILAVGTRTLLQGLSSDDALAQLFGLIEGISMLAIAFGAAAFSGLAVATSMSTALVILGLFPIVVLVVLAPSLLAIDRSRPDVDPDLVALLRGMPLFAALPAFRLEQVLVSVSPVNFAAGEQIFHQGDSGDLFYAIADGSATVGLASGDAALTRGEFFGEIALLRDQPRMASVSAGPGGLATYALDRDTFLEAVSSAPTGRSRADRVVQHRLGE